MLALSDAALARLCIGASRVSHGRRKRWLRAIAANLEPVRSPASATHRKRRQRAHHRNGEHHYGLWISDRAVEGLILKMIIEGRLSEAEAMNPRSVEAALAQLLEEEGNRWAR